MAKQIESQTDSKLALCNLKKGGNKKINKVMEETCWSKYIQYIILYMYVYLNDWHLLQEKHSTNWERSYRQINLLLRTGLTQKALWLMVYMYEWPLLLFLSPNYRSDNHDCIKMGGKGGISQVYTKV